MSRFVAIFIALSLAGPALGQTTTTANIVTQAFIIRTPESDFVDTITFRGDACEATYSVKYKYTQGFAPGGICSDFVIWATDAKACADAPASNEPPLLTVGQYSLTATPTQVFNVHIAALPGFVTSTLSDGGVTSATACGDPNIKTTVTHRICGAATPGTLGSISPCAYVTTSTAKLKASELKLIYDTEPPVAPVIEGEPKGANGQATILFQANTDAAKVVPVVTLVGVDGGADEPTDPRAAVPIVSTARRVSITGLQNYRTYRVQLYFIDAAGNEGPLSAPAFVTPIKTVGFWQIYKDAGGTSEGGCSSTGLGLLPLLAGVWLFLRRTSR